MLGVASSILTIMAQHSAWTIRSIEEMPLSSRGLVAAHSLVAYLWKMLAPFALSPFYPYPGNAELLTPEYLVSVALLIAITVASFVMARKHKLPLAVWGYYVVTLIPVSGIVQVGAQSMANRYTYLPSIGPFLVIGLVASKAWESAGSETMHRLRARATYAAAALMVLIAMSYLTYRQIMLWENGITLWSDVIDNNHAGVEFAFSNRGLVFARTGQLDKAIEDFNRAIALSPDDPKAYYNRGLAFDGKGEYDKAIADFSKAISLTSSYYVTHFNMYYWRGLDFEKTGQMDKAIADFEKTIALNPAQNEARMRLGVLYGRVGSPDKAIEHFSKVIQQSPNNDGAYSNRGFAYSLMGQRDNALRDLSKAIELNKNNAAAYFNRGHIYLKAGRKDLALSDFRIACDIGSKEGCAALQSVMQGGEKRNARSHDKTKP